MAIARKRRRKKKDKRGRIGGRPAESHLANMTDPGQWHEMTAHMSDEDRTLVHDTMRELNQAGGGTITVSELETRIKEDPEFGRLINSLMYRNQARTGFEDMEEAGLGEFDASVPGDEKFVLNDEGRKYMDDLRHSRWGSEVMVATGSLNVSVGKREIPVLPAIRVESMDDRSLPIVPGKVELLWSQSKKKGKVRGRLRIRDVEDGRDFTDTRKVGGEWEVFSRLRDLWRFWYLELATKSGSHKESYVVGMDGLVWRLPKDELMLEVDWLQSVVGDPNARRRRAALRDAKLRQWEAMGKKGKRGYGRKSATLAAQEIEGILEDLGGPLPWVPTEREVREIRHDAVVSNYLLLIKHMYKLKDDPSVRLLWPDFTQSRIFEMDAASILDLTQMAASIVRPIITENEEVDPTADYWIRRLRDLSRQVEYPSPLPFDRCYLAWGEGVPMGSGWYEDDKKLADLSQLVAGNYGTGADEQTILLGTLLTGNKASALFLGRRDRTLGEESDILLRESVLWTKDGGWTERGCGTLSPWILNAAVANINSHRVVQQGSMRMRHELNRMGKRLRVRMPVPPPYYVVPMRAQVMRRNSRKTMKRSLDVEWSHRWDVRGHECAKVQRGRMPIDPKERDDLIKRGYDVFTVGQLSPEAVEVMLTRGMEPRRPDEWVAVKVWWRDQIIKGPADKPYIPSVHRPMGTAGGDDGQEDPDP